MCGMIRGSGVRHTHQKTSENASSATSIGKPDKGDARGKILRDSKGETNSTHWVRNAEGVSDTESLGESKGVFITP